MRAGRVTKYWEKGEVPVGRPMGTSIKIRVSVESLMDTKRNPGSHVGGPTSTHKKNLSLRDTRVRSSGNGGGLALGLGQYREVEIGFNTFGSFVVVGQQGSVRAE